MTTTEPSLVDLSDNESFRNGFPHDTFVWLRANDPVHWHEPTAKTPDGEGFWVVSRHADVVAVQRDAATYSSERGGGRERGGTGLKDERTAGTMLNMTDDPQHQRLRSLVNRGFTPRAVGALEAELRRRAAALLDRLPAPDATGAVEFDAVVDFSRELPAQAICLVLGVPESDRAQLLEWLDRGIEEDTPSIVSADTRRHLREYATELIATKRANPDGGIMSTIIEARSDDDGSQLSDAELIAFFGLLFPAGAETTRSAIGGAVKVFVDHPEQYERLRADRSLLPTAIEEIVRWTTPSVYKRRTATIDTTLGGRTIRAGDKVTFWEMSANRDDTVFDDPFRFDVGRHPNPHVGFGWGVHFCLGASLARLEMKTALDALLDRYASFDSAGPHEWMPNNRLFGLKRLPVRAVVAPAGPAPHAEESHP